MKYLLLEKDFENRDALDLITTYSIEEFLESQFAENVVQEIWRSPYATFDSILAASTNHYLTFHWWHCVRDLEYEHRVIEMQDVTKIEAHPMQFTVWRFSPKARTLIEFIVTVAFATVIHLLVDSFFSQIPRMEEYVANLEQAEAGLLAFRDRASQESLDAIATVEAFRYAFEDHVLEFWTTMRWITWLGFMVLFFFLNQIPALIYTSKTKRQFNAYVFKNIWDFVIFVFFFTFIMISYRGNLEGTWKEKQTVTVALIRADTYARNFCNGSVLFETYLLIFAVMSMWIRAFYMLRYNEYFGRLTGIVTRLIPDLAVFFLFYLVEIFFFAMVAQQAFRRLEEFNTWERAYSTLFYASFGLFNFSVFEEQETTFGHFFGLTFVVFFLAINIGLFMSLFVSMLTTLYGEYVRRETIYQMLEKLKIRPVTQADKEYSVLISLPAPLNAIHLFLAPFLLVSRNPEQVNKAILWVAYLPILIISFLVFATYNIVLLPLSALKIFFHKMIMIFVYSKSHRVTRADKFMLWILFAVVGPFRLVANVLLDMVVFLKHCTLTNLKKNKVQIRDKPLAKKSLVMLSKYFVARNERMIPFKQVAAEVRDQMSVFQKIAQIFNAQPIVSFLRGAVEVEQDAEVLGADEFDFIFQQVREFTTAKAILEGNSEHIVYQKQRVKAIDCKVMSVLLEDVLR